MDVHPNRCRAVDAVIGRRQTIHRFRSALVVAPWLAVMLLVAMVASGVLAQDPPASGDEGVTGQTACPYGWHWDFFVQECVRDPTPTPTP